MKKIENFYDTKQFCDLFLKCDSKIEFKNIFTKYDDTLNSISRKRRFCELLCDLITNNPDCVDYEDLLMRYKNEKSTIKKVEIRYGKSTSETLSNRLSLNAKTNNANPNKLNVFKINYYTEKGFTIEEAKQKIHELQSANALKSHKNKRKNNSYRSHNPMCIEYWIDRSNDPYNDCIAYKNDNCHSLENFKRKYGDEEGIAIFEEIKNSRRNTMLKRYGVFGFSTHSSKSGRKLCLRLFKRFRRLGFKKDDMCAAIGDLREFARTDIINKKTYFYDFCLKPLKLIIEYNGTYFHPRDRLEWRRRDITFETALKRDQDKVSFIEKLGYHVIVVWEDSDIDSKITEILEYAKTKLAK